MTEPVVHLRAGGTSVVVIIDGGRLPRIIHWGADLGEVDAMALARTALPAIGDSPVTYPQPIPVVAQLSEGWLGRPGVVGSSSGTRWAPLFRDARYTVEGNTLRCVAVDAEYDLSLVIDLELLPSGLVRQREPCANATVSAVRPAYQASSSAKGGCSSSGIRPPSCATPAASRKVLWTAGSFST